MSIYMIIGSLFHRRTTTLSSISISLIFLLISNPYSIFDIGLQLSYGGTIGICYLKDAFWKNSKKQNKIKEMLKIAISANIIIFPITLLHFNTLSTIFLLSNLFASPLLGIIIILGFMMIIISFIYMPLSKIFAIPLKIILQMFLKIANITGNLPFAQIYLPTPNLVFLIIYYLLILIFTIYKKIKQKSEKSQLEEKLQKIINKKFLSKLFLIVLVLLIIFIIFCKFPQNLEIHFIDVGQGDSSLIITPMHKSILIDGGGSGSTSFDVGINTLIPYLLDKGIIKLNYIIISHFDSDHVRPEY